MSDTDYREYLVHFSHELSPEIKQFATDEVFKHSRYIFAERIGKQQYGYCTYCRKEFPTSGTGLFPTNKTLKHNSEVICPYCKSKCIVKHAGLGRSRMIDEGYFVYYEKSVVDPKVITARGIYAVRDYRGAYRNLETKYKVQALYVFQMGGSTMLERYAYYSMANTMQSGSFSKNKSVFSLYGKYHNNSLNVVCKHSRASIEKAVKGTQFRYSTWEQYSEGDMVKFFDLYSRYPCVEYLTKLGFEGIVEAKLTGANTYGAINWRGKSFERILKVSKADFNELRAIQNARYSVSTYFLKLFQISKVDGSCLSAPEIKEVERTVEYFHFKDFQYILKHTSLRKAHQYLIKQYEKDRKTFYSRAYVLSTWKDYLRDCKILQMDLESERVLFPKNLHTAHQNTIKQIKLKENEALDKKIIARAKSLQKYCFEDNGILIRPAESYKELLEESKTLHHCVATHYSEGYAKGEYMILVIRKMSDPQKPFYTMQIRQDRIIQTRGKSNCDPTSEVRAFVKTFESEILTKKDSKEKISVPA